MKKKKEQTLVLVLKDTHEEIKKLAEQEQRTIKVMMDIIVKYWKENHR